jgi:WD40 repeat protein
MMRLDCCRVVARSSLLIAMALFVAVSPLSEADEELVPDDTCYVELELPPGATVRVGTKDHGAKRRITFRPLTPGKPYKTKFTITFADGQTAERDIVLRGGWHTRLPVRPSDVSRPELLLQVGHNEEITAIAFSPDGTRVLTASRDSTAIVWDAVTGRTLLSLQGHPGELHAAAFSADGARIVTLAKGGAVYAWDAASGKELRTIEGTKVTGQAGFTFLDSGVCSPDGGLLALSFRDSTKHPYPSGPTNATAEESSAFYRADSRKTPREVVIWDMKAGRRLRKLASQPGDMECLAISGNRRRVAAGSETGIVYLWDIASGGLTRRLTGHKGEIECVALSADGRRLISTDDKEQTYLWNADTGERLHAMKGAGGSIEAAAFNADGTLAITVHHDGQTHVWDVASGAKVASFATGLESARVTAFSPRGDHVALGNSNGAGTVWNIAQATRVVDLRGQPRNYQHRAALSPDGNRAAAGAEDGTATIWDLHSGRPLQVLRGHDSDISGIEYSPDGRRVLTGSWDETAALWDATTGEKLHVFSGLEENIDCVGFSPEGGRVAIGTWGSRLLVYNTSTGKRAWSIPNGKTWVKSIAFTPDGGRVAVVRETTARIWDLTTGQQVRSIPLKFKMRNNQNQEVDVALHGATSLRFSNDGRALWVAGLVGSVLSFDVATGNRQRQFNFTSDGLPTEYNDLEISADGRMVLVAVAQRSAFIFDLTTGQIVREFVGHTGAVNSADFSADGSRVLTASDDGTMRLWDVATGDELARMMTFNQGNDWLVVTPEGFFDGSEAGRQMVSWRIPSAGQVVPVERFFQDFYRPGLLAEVHGGGRPLPEVELGESLPPRVRIVSPERSGPTDNQRVTVEVEVADGGGGIQGPWLRHNGARVASAGQAIKEGQTVRQTFTVSLIEGDNRLRVEAASADGSWESEPALLTLNYTQTLEKPELYIVAVGVNDYAEPSLRLSFAAQDARDMVQVFSRRAAKLYEQTHVTELIDGQATKEAIRGALADVAAKAQPQDALLVFLSGHGFTVGQRYYFIPPEFQKQSERIEDDIRRDGYAIDELGDAFRAVPALKRMLVLDTCNSGAAIAQSTQKGRNPFAFQGAIERLSRAQGIFTLAAAAATDDTVEVQELEHGVLTYSLLAGLRAVDHGPLADKWVQPDNAEQVVGVLEWFNFATGQVPRLTKQYTGQAQDVQMSGEGTSFPVLPLGE